MVYLADESLSLAPKKKTEEASTAFPKAEQQVSDPDGFSEIFRSYGSDLLAGLK
jgi:hypothetical protein